MSAGSLLIQSRQLYPKNGALPFPQPVIGSINVMAVEPLAGHAAAIVDRPRQPFDGIVVCEDHSSFTRGHQLAGLEAESCCIAKCTDSPSSPFAAMGMRAVLYQSDTAVASDSRKTVQIGGMAAHVDCNDGFRARSDCRFHQVGINAIRIRENVHHYRQCSVNEIGTARR